MIFHLSRKIIDKDCHVEDNWIKLAKSFLSTFPIHKSNNNSAYSLLNHVPQRIIENLGKLLEDYPSLLNEHERFIILASAYLHDIGMQSPQHSELPKKVQYSIKEMEQIRENHHSASAKMILESIRKQSDLQLGLEKCKDYTEFVATLSRYHRKIPLDDIKDTSIAGNPIKIQLLSGLLRLGDALDADFRRVNMNILKLRKIPVESKSHWWFHHYVQSVDITKGHIQIYYRFPSEYKNNKILDVFRNKIQESIQGQLTQVYDLFEKYSLRLYPRIEIMEESYTPEGQLELISDDLKNYINQTILKPLEISKETTTKSGVIWYVDGVPYSDDVEVAKSLTRIYHFIEENNNLDAIKEIERCSTLTMAPKVRMIFSLPAGNCFLNVGDLSKAESYYEEVLTISKRKDLQEIYKNEMMLGKSSAFGNIGIIYRINGKFDIALKYHEKALKIYQNIKDEYGEASVLENIGIVYGCKDNLDTALLYFKKALKIYQESEYIRGIKSAFGNIGIIYRTKRELDTAFRYFEDCLRISRDIGDKQDEARSLVNLGIVYVYKNEFDTAFQSIKEALQISKQTGIKQGEAAALASLGYANLRKDELDTALQYYEKALKIYHEIGNRQGEANMSESIGLDYLIKGEYDTGLQYIHNAFEIIKKYKLPQNKSIFINAFKKLKKQKKKNARHI